MYSVGDLDASAAKCHTLAGGDAVGQRGGGSGDPDCLCRPGNDHMSDSHPNAVEHSNRLRWIFKIKRKAIIEALRRGGNQIRRKRVEFVQIMEGGKCCGIMKQQEQLWGRAVGPTNI
jgi:hypothetical protein